VTTLSNATGRGRALCSHPKNLLIGDRLRLLWHRVPEVGERVTVL